MSRIAAPWLSGWWHSRLRGSGFPCASPRRWKGKDRESTMRAAFLSFVSAWCALAQSTVTTSAPPQNVMQLSMKRAVEIALTPEGSPRVVLAMESVKQAQDKAREAKAAFLPTVDGSIRETSETVNLKTFGINFPTV